jgi:peptide/nickel transport system substrate-binding protein
MILLILLLAGVVPGGTAVAADESTTRRVGLVGGPDGINPIAGWGSWVTDFTYEYLVAGGPDRSGATPPAFASSWSGSNGGTTWTYKIDPDKKWSDGEPATARDAAATLRYVLDTKGTPHEFNTAWNNVNSFTGLLEDPSNIRVIDDQTLELTLLKPQAEPPYFGTFILPEHILRDIDPADIAAMATITATGELPLVGSGDFIATEWEQGKFHRLIRNPYKPAAPGGVEEVLFVYFGTAEAEAAALVGGQIDVALDAPVATLPSLDADPNIDLTTVVIPEYNFLAFNTAPDAGASSTALADPAFRSALGYAIDNQTLVDRVLLGNAQPGLSLISPSLAGYWEAAEAKIGSNKRTFDLAAASAKLDDAGYRDTDGDGIREDREGRPLQLRLYLSSEQPNHAQSAQFISEWFRQVGVDVTPTALDSATLSGKLAAPADGGGGWDLAINRFWPNPPRATCSRQADPISPESRTCRTGRTLSLTNSGRSRTRRWIRRNGSTSQPMQRHSSMLRLRTTCCTTRDGPSHTGRTNSPTGSRHRSRRSIRTR